MQHEIAPVTEVESDRAGGGPGWLLGSWPQARAAWLPFLGIQGLVILWRLQLAHKGRI